MSGELSIRQRQRTRRVDVRGLRRVAIALLAGELGLRDYVLGVHLVGARTMARLNWQWLRHEGSTDILTFDESAFAGEEAPPARIATGSNPGTSETIRGELFISVADAVLQAREFRTDPGAELVRYLVHGVLHLRGYDDLEAAARRQMKREENRLVRRLARRFALRPLLR